MIHDSASTPDSYCFLPYERRDAWWMGWMMMIMVMITLENDKTWDEASLLRSRFWARHATLLPRGGERFVTSLKTAAKETRKRRGWLVRPLTKIKKALGLGGPGYEIAKWRTTTENLKKCIEKILDSLQWKHQVNETSVNRIST